MRLGPSGTPADFRDVLADRCRTESEAFYISHKFSMRTHMG